MDPAQRVDQPGAVDEFEPNPPPSDELDLGLDDIEREADLATLARVEFELAEVEHAMRRIEDGSYGACETCRSPIEADLLEMQPTARMCRTHQQPTEA